MNTDEEGMDTDGSICFAKQLNHPCPSVYIRVHHLQALRSCGSHHLRPFTVTASKPGPAL